VPAPPSLGKDLLTVIVPLTRMAGRMANLKTWLSESTDLPINVVIVHDIQDPFTSQELEQLVKNFGQLDIQVIEKTCGSPGLARNVGLQGSLGIWTAFWDADDLPDPQEAINAIAQVDSHVEVIIGNFTRNSPRGLYGSIHQHRLENVALNPGLWRMIIRSSILEGKSFSAELMGEDQLFLVDLNLGSREIEFSDRFFYQYIQGSPMQLTSNQDSVNEVEKTLISLHKKMQKHVELRNKFSEIILLRLLMTTIFRTKANGKPILIIKHASILFLVRPRTLCLFILNLSKSCKKS